MTQEHPITPPPELFKQWEDDILNERDNVDHVLDCAWRNGFQAGADQELETCCKWLTTTAMAKPWETVAELALELHIARRSKSASLKDEVKQIIDCLVEGDCFNDEDETTLRRALEQLND